MVLAGQTFLWGDKMITCNYSRGLNLEFRLRTNDGVFLLIVKAGDSEDCDNLLEFVTKKFGMEKSRFIADILIEEGFDSFPFFWQCSQIR